MIEINTKMFKKARLWHEIYTHTGFRRGKDAIYLTRMYSLPFDPRGNNHKLDVTIKLSKTQRHYYFLRHITSVFFDTSSWAHAGDRCTLFYLSHPSSHAEEDGGTVTRKTGEVDLPVAVDSIVGGGSYSIIVPYWDITGSVLCPYYKKHFALNTIIS